MVLAILDGRKTVTRRVVKKSQCMLADRKEPHELDRKYAPYDSMMDAELVACTYRPPYKPGDILYVRETWAQIKDIPFWQKYFCGDTRTHPIFPDEYIYKADNINNVNADGILPDIKWHPSIHMQKEAARIWLKVTDVRVERLQDMTGQDILREGVNCHVHPEAHYFEGNQKMMFAELWDSTIKKSNLKHYGWDANPWVWVIEFRVIEFERYEKQRPCILAGVEPADDKRPCIGYGKSEMDDEPCDMCKGCRLCSDYEEETAWDQ